MRPEAFLAASAFSRNECDDEAKPKAASGDDTNRLTKPACVQISTFLHARRHLELVCADFLAGRGDESSPEEILMVIHHLVHLLPREYQENLAGQGGGKELETAGKC